MKLDLLFRKIIDRLLEFSIFHLIPDKPYLKAKFWAKTGVRLNLQNPKSFSEKLQWLKLYDRKDSYSLLVDKIAVKELAVSVMGEKAVLPTLAVWTDADAIDLTLLPEAFVMKCNHDSGSTIICRNKNEIDIDFIRNKLKRSLRINYYYGGREYPYKWIKPMIFAEECIPSQDPIDDYKIFCFEGEPKFIVRYSDTVDHERAMDFYDISWNRLKIKKPAHPSGDTVEAPACLGEMIEYSKQFSGGLHFLRVDFVYTNKKLYFGELTLFPSSGFNSFEPSEYDDIFGSWIKIRENE